MAFQSAQSKIRIAEQDKLISLGYIISRLSEYHFRITRNDSRDCVDVWPTTKKLMKFGWAKSSTYTNLVYELEPLFHVKKQEPQKKNTIPKLSKRMEEYYEYRKDPMKFIRDKMKLW